jgi:hypothetical protein
VGQPPQVIGGGLTYSQLSAKGTGVAANAVLAAQGSTVFKGTTLRGMLLNASQPPAWCIPGASADC